MKKRIAITLKQTLHENFRDRIWIGYSIKKKNCNNKFCLKYKRDNLPFNYPTLKQLITGNKSFAKSNEDEKNSVFREATIIALKKLGNKNALGKIRKTRLNHNKVTNEFAILMDYSLESGRPRVYQVFILPLEQSFNLKGKNLYWLGNISQKESFDWLCYLFCHNHYLKLRHQLLSAIDSHTSSASIFQFFYDVIFGKFEPKLKEYCIFWLGRNTSALSDQILCKIINDNINNKLTPKAILALSHSKRDKAFKFLSSLAKKGKNKTIRKEAIFSLSQMDNEKSLFILNDIVTKDRDSDIREFGVFVISQIPNKKVFPILKQISKTHPDFKVRKKALYWADKTHNNTAINYLKDVVRKTD